MEILTGPIHCETSACSLSPFGGVDSSAVSWPATVIENIRNITAATANFMVASGRYMAASNTAVGLIKRWSGGLDSLETEVLAASIRRCWCYARFVFLTRTPRLNHRRNFGL